MGPICPYLTRTPPDHRRRPLGRGGARTSGAAPRPGRRRLVQPARPPDARGRPRPESSHRTGHRAGRPARGLLGRLPRTRRALLAALGTAGRSSRSEDGAEIASSSPTRAARKPAREPGGACALALARRAVPGGVRPRPQQEPHPCRGRPWRTSACRSGHRPGHRPRAGRAVCPGPGGPCSHPGHHSAGGTPAAAQDGGPVPALVRRDAPHAAGTGAGNLVPPHPPGREQCDRVRARDRTVRARPRRPGASMTHPDQPALWPATLTIEEGRWQLGGHLLTDLAEGFGTPSYLLDVDGLRERARHYRNAFTEAFGPGTEVYYAGKAFLSMAVARWVHEAGLRIDTASLGELTTALAAGVAGA